MRSDGAKHIAQLADIPVLEVAIKDLQASNTRLEYTPQTDFPFPARHCLFAFGRRAQTTVAFQQPNHYCLPIALAHIAPKQQGLGAAWYAMAELGAVGFAA